jgi:hypothetical protein
MGMTSTTIQAPWVNLVTAITTATTGRDGAHAIDDKPVSPA